MRYLIKFIIFFSTFVSSQTIQLNEIVANNSSTLFDEDGDTPDWIEIYNPTNTPINLFDFRISDDPNNPSKWIFPSLDIESNEFLIIFASDKDRKEMVLEWDAIIDWEDEWFFWIGDSEPISNWELPETDISFWDSGNSGFGYGDNDDNTEIGQVISVYIKKEFIIEDPSIILKALFHIDYDDGYISYLNGVEFSRRNLGEPGSDIFYNTTTTGLHEAEIYSGGFPEKVEIDLNTFPLEYGINTLSVQVHNYTGNSSDLSCIPFLTLGYSSETENSSEPNPLLNLPKSFLHTNFKISSSGETLILSNQDEMILDSITFGNMNSDMSYGRRLEGNSWALFNQPTPMESNTSTPFAGFLSNPEFSMGSGFFDQSQIPVEITTVEDLATIYFTLDGTSPTINDNIYTLPIILNSNTVVRARSFLEGWIPSATETKTYMISDESPNQIPLIFLTTNPNSFFDQDTGMYVMGPNAEWNFPHFGANFWEDWERPIHFEILEPDGSGYSADAGAKIFGGWSRGFPQKSLSIFSRSYIGPSSFNYQLFPNSSIDSYEAFVLRNSGNDWESTMLRDGFITGIANALNIDHQQYRPAILYINGDFWGIQNIREKVNEHFISSNHSIPSHHVDLLDLEGLSNENIINGTNTDYQNLIEYIENQEDMTAPTVKIALENWIDIESYMSYQAFQIYIDNRDWPGNNIKFWRDHRAGGKWRWILYDTDFGFSIWDEYAYSFNTLEFALEPNGPGWPNPPWSTFIFRKLLENNSFKHTFINIYCDMINTVFMQESLIPHLDSLASKIQDIIPDHRLRWYNNGDWPNSAINWQYKVNTIENYIIQRPSYAISHLQNAFNLPDIEQMTLNIEPQSGGKISLNSLTISDRTWQGYYFPTVPLQIKAIPNDGYEFSHWIQFPDSNATMEIYITNPFSLTAVFTETNLISGTVVINEINYNSSNEFDTEDWIEIYNPGEMDINISGWRLKDNNNDHSYIIPEETILNAEGYLIISNDPNAFYNYYSNEIPLVGPFDFGLGGGGDEVRIFDNEYLLIDSVQYDDNDPWPNEPDGNGYTLELLNPYIDNALPESWTSSNQYGSPGQQNSNFLSAVDENDSDILLKDILLPAYPNPFNGSITIPFNLSNQTNSSIVLYNILGKEIKFFPIKNFNRGKNSILWSGDNQVGQKVGSGIYLIRLSSGNNTQTQKLIYLK